MADVSTIHSQSALDCPITVFGFAALSVETSTNRFAPYSTATSASVLVPSVLLRTASIGFASIIATCLYAAAWKTTPGRYLSKTCAHLHAILDVGDDGDAGEEAALADELPVDLEQSRLGVVDQHEPGGPEAGELAAELGADRAAGARDHHDLAR